MKQVEVMYIIPENQKERDLRRRERIDKYTKLIQAHKRGCKECKGPNTCNYYNAFVVLISDVLSHDEDPGRRVFKYHQDWDTFREV